ncbi:hypothetical protein BGZ72_004467 [Mortierella alpina]|nr:hypothetical protein BGZ72_004467 [Mortierella alpina]
MDVDPQDLQADMAVNHIEQVDQTEQDVTMMTTVDGSPTSRGDVLKILGQTIHDGGAVKYTVFWENGESTEESVEALGQWDDLVQEYEHSQFSKSEGKSDSPSPPPASRKAQSSSAKTGDSDASKKRNLVASRPTRTKARVNVQYYEGGEDSDEGGDYSSPRSSKKVTAKSKKASSSGDDGQDQDPDTPPATTLSARGYPRRAQATVKPQPALESSDDSSDELATPKTKAERKIPSAPKPKKVLVATSTESTFVQAHHPFCTRCGQRGEITKRKSKKKSDDEEDDEPLGSLLLCECCSAGYHRLCLRKTYTDSLIGTGFRCEACIKTKGAECMECRLWVGRAPPSLPTKAADVTESVAVSAVESSAGESEPPAEGAVPSNQENTAAELDNATQGSSEMQVEDSSAKEMPKKMEDSSEASNEPPDVLFRCFRCTYTAHDHCLKPMSTMEKGIEQSQIIRHYRKDWKCHQCLEWDSELDQILAFRDVPIFKAIVTPQEDGDTDLVMADSSKSEMNVAESASKDGSTFPQASNTTRELLVKWKNMSYRKVTWVPSYWVSQVVSSVKIKSFWKRTAGPAEISDVIMDEWTQVEKILDVRFDGEYDGNGDDMDALDHIQSVFVKWKSLDYDQATWDEPDEPDSPNYASFKQAFKDWVSARKIEIPARAKKGRSGLQPRPLNQLPFEELKEQPSYVTGGTLKDYQMDGLNWLRYNHWKNVNSILADEMGLGKTIQMVAFVTTLYHQLRAFPCLIVVPNSTLTNWVREFAKWAPDLRVVAYYGPQTSRSVVRDYELFHPGTHDLKCHVVVTTYEMIVNATDGSLFRKNSWECLVVDEGQRLKNENSMLFVKLNELVIENRVLLTGTPLQNNIRELFSLMNFLDPVKFADVTELEKKYENLDKAAVEELHGLLKPFFLRRTKDEVLKDLPPKSEVIVPVGMSALQKEIYKGILARNHKLLQSITNRGGTSSNRKASLHNILMELRKCLNHPYLIEGVEPRYLNTAELVHKSLIEAGGKLELLHNMLPKLKQGGHRVLIFSTMTRLLDILEDYLNGERYNYVRLDGSTSSSDRQARIDKFNAPDSDVFVFLLSTRAGGVGVNLATADTIIIYDVDFNPKADMQALSRAHRIGQKNKVLVLKFMTRNSAEERIVQIGKKKMILDHLIVERMEDDNLDPIDVESILKFGAKALFEEESTTNEDLKYDDAALEALLDRSKIEHNWDDTDNGETKVSGFGFAKVWTETKGLVDEDIPIDAPPETEEEGFWSTLLRDRLAMAYAQEEELLGRGARRKTVLSYAENGNNNESPPNKKRKAGKEVPSKEEEDYVDADLLGSDVESVDSDTELDPNTVLAELEMGKKSKKNRSAMDPNQSPSQLGYMDMDDDSRRDTFGGDGSPAGLHGNPGKIKKARMHPLSPYQVPGAGMQGGRVDAAIRKTARKPQPCLVCHRSHRDRCPESQDIPLVLERRQQIATSNYPDNYKTLALNTLDKFLLDKHITPAELPKGKAARNLSAAAARLGGSAYQENLRSMSIGKAFVPTITPGACIVCNQVPYHLPFKCPETKNTQFLQERCRGITLDPTISDSKKQEYVSTIKALMSREAPRTNPPAPSSGPRRSGPWPGAGASGANGPPSAPLGPPSMSNASSRGTPTSAGAMGVAAASGQSGPSMKHGHSGQRPSQSHHSHSQHQAYTSQIPPQFMSSRPSKDQQHHHSNPASSSGPMSGRSDNQRQRDYGYHGRGAPHAHHTGSGHIASGVRESNSYQARKASFRAEDGSMMMPPGRGSFSGNVGPDGQDYVNESSQESSYGRERERERERERDPAGYGRVESSRQGVHHERDRDRNYHHPDESLHGHHDYGQTENGLYSSTAPSRSSQHHASVGHYPGHHSEHPAPHSQHPQHRQHHQHSHQQQRHHAQQQQSSHVRPPHGGQIGRPVSMSPQNEHRALGQAQGHYTTDRSESHPNQETIVDHDMTSPTQEAHAARVSQPQDEHHQDHDQHPQQQARVNGEVHHERVPKRALSPGQSPQADHGSEDGAESVPSSSIDQGGLVAAASLSGGAGARSGYHGGPVVTPMDDGYGNGHGHGHGHVHAHGNGTDKFQAIRTGGMGKMDKVDMTDDRAEATAPMTTMAPEALTAELRINERHQAFVNN